MKRISSHLILLIFVLLLIPTFSVWASDYMTISTAELKSKLDAKENFLLVYVLGDIEFSFEHIPSSVNITPAEIKTTDKLPPNKDALIVFY